MDGIVHCLGLGATAVAVAVLFLVGSRADDTLVTISLAVYGAGLVSMVSMSATYNLVDRPEWKEIARRFDHAAIFVMIAGTYTPFMLIGVGGALGHGLLAFVWFAAGLGVAIKLLYLRRFERISLALYLALGWIVLPALGPLSAALPISTLALLLAGGILYTAGVAFYLWDSLSFNNAIWHAFVLAGAACHFLAVLKVVPAT